MKVSDYIVDFLIQKGVTDVFGIPGGVVLDFLYALDRRKIEISPHLNYHEQSAAFAACGYAQASGKPGVAYATRGPGLTNMITAIAEAYYESIPILIITAHAAPREKPQMRIEMDQDMDPIPLVRSITKYANRIERADDVQRQMELAFHIAETGRKGPVVLDFAARLFKAELVSGEGAICPADKHNAAKELEKCLRTALRQARRPVFLIGNGVKLSGTTAAFRKIAEKAQIPVISSHIAQDTMPDSPMYFGYIGSRGTRYGNFILAKSDLIISFGNRMSFPINSSSFYPVVNEKSMIRVDVDETEFLREFPNCTNFLADLADILPELVQKDLTSEHYTDWVAVCNTLKETLWEYDIEPPISTLTQLLSFIPAESTLVSDVGNNALWLARAYAHEKIVQQVIYSKSFSALGCSLSKGIGAYYGKKKPVVCFTGDQGFQFNIQELQFLVSNNIPLVIILLNNFSSGMIRSREKQQFPTHFVHTTRADGYGVPNFESIAKAYGLGYILWDAENRTVAAETLHQISKPCLIELLIDESIDLVPSLPIGNPCQDLAPILSRELYIQLEQL